MEHIDALEAVRRLTLERDALANELDAVKDDFRVSRQTLDSIRAATGMYSYGHHLAESLKAMKEDRDALAEQVKRLEVDALQPLRGTNAPKRVQRRLRTRTARHGAVMCLAGAGNKNGGSFPPRWGRERGSLPTTQTFFIPEVYPDTVSLVY